jgi:methionine-rich copper-binding protein CopC
MVIRRYAIAVVVGLVAMVWSATPALAHAELIASNPATGATLAAAPTMVELTFNEPVTLGANPVYVLGPGGVTWTIQPPTVSGPVVLAQVVPSGPAGDYSIVYEVLSKDKDLVRGAVTFTLTEPATSPPPAPVPSSPDRATPEPPAAPAAPEPGVPVSLWVVIAVVIIGAVVTLAIRLRRR